MTILGEVLVDHIDMAKRAEILDATALEFYDTNERLSQEDYQKIVAPCTSLFKIILVNHFRVEETALFPVFIEKNQHTRQIIRELVSTHLYLIKMFSEFETIEDQNLSLKFLANLMKGLLHHIGKEDKFFPSFAMSSEETMRIEELARRPVTKQNEISWLSMSDLEKKNF